MTPPPANWPRLSSCVFYRDPKAAIDWLVRAFGFEVRLKVEGPEGQIEHSELVFGGGLIMVGAANGQEPAYRARQRSPLDVDGANTQCLCIYVDNVDAHCAQARAAGGQVYREPTTSDYGEGYWVDRSYGVLDPEGHQWWFMQRLSG